MLVSVRRGEFGHRSYGSRQFRGGDIGPRSIIFFQDSGSRAPDMPLQVCAQRSDDTKAQLFPFFSQAGLLPAQAGDLGAGAKEDFTRAYAPDLTRLAFCRNQEPQHVRGF